MYRIEIVWNREFHWSYWATRDDLQSAKNSAISIRDSGDGARVKKARIINTETDKIVWEG